MGSLDKEFKEGAASTDFLEVVSSASADALELTNPEDLDTDLDSEFDLTATLESSQAKHASEEPHLDANDLQSSDKDEDDIVFADTQFLATVSNDSLDHDDAEEAALSLTDSDTSSSTEEGLELTADDDLNHPDFEDSFDSQLGTEHAFSEDLHTETASTDADTSTLADNELLAEAEPASEHSSGESSASSQTSTDLQALFSQAFGPSVTDNDAEAQVTLELAEQYVRLGERTSAAELLNEVIRIGSDEQKTRAAAMLEQIGR